MRLRMAGCGDGRRIAGLALALACALLTAACGSRPELGVLAPVTRAATIGKPVSFLVATTRRRSRDIPGAFDVNRASELNYERYVVSLPPTHKTSEIEFPKPGATPDPATDFVVRAAAAIDEKQFTAEIARRIRDRHAGAQDVMVFVHGYNTNYPEALFRGAQLVGDSAFPGVPVMFVWPSLGTLTGYLADRESVTYSRDYLEQALNQIARVPGVRSINIVAHSMGNWLAVETLRQAKIRGTSPFLPKLGEVYLMSPDIDVQVFRTQLDAIGPLRRQITVVLAKDDIALAASQRLAGGIPRLGNFLISNPRAQAEIAEYNLRIIDLSDVKGADSLSHSKFVYALPALRQIAESGALARQGEARNAGIFVVDAAGEILRTPLRVGAALIGE